MAKGHIKLGVSVAALREYQMYYERYRKLQVNPYSAKLSTGGDEYDDLGPWAYHVERDWQAGMGHKDEEAGGFLFSSAETRVPNQIMLPQYIRQFDTRQVTGNVDDCRNIGRLAAQRVLTIGPTQTRRKLRWRIDIPVIEAITFYMSVYCRIPTGTTITASVYTTATGTTLHNEGGGASEAQVIGTDDAGMNWHRLRFGANTVFGAGTAGTYWFEILPDADIEVPVTNDYTDSGAYYHNGTTWVAEAHAQPIYTTLSHFLGTTHLATTNTHIVRFNGTLYGSIDTQLYKWNSTTGVWSTVGAARAAAITSIVPYVGYLYIGLASGNYDRMSTGEVYSAGSVNLEKFVRAGGYLYAYKTNNVYYTGDGTTWTGPIAVGDSTFPITGLADLNEQVYVATAEALYYISFNIPRGMTRWGSYNSTNGTGMLQHQGALYAIVNGGVAQISVSGGSATILPIWVSRDDDGVASQLYVPVALRSTNNWLTVLVRGDPSTTNNYRGVTRVLVWTGQGWHHLASMPYDYYSSSMYHDPTASLLWVTGPFANYAARVPDYTINPVNDYNSIFDASGWVETPWITGGLVDVEKDFESVYISGEELAAGQTVTVFWKVRGGSWTELGTVDADGEELRWSTYATRPSAKEIKLGFRLFSTSLTATPTIDAIRLKYRPNVTDRWQWSLVLPFHDNQEMIDGDLNSYTGAQMLAHFEGLVKQTPPFFMEDVDGTQYEVVCTGYDLNLEKFEYYDTGKKVWWIAQATLEQSYAA